MHVDNLIMAHYVLILGGGQGTRMNNSTPKQFLEINSRLSKKWPILTEIKEAPVDAKDWEGKEGKLSLLEE